MDNWKIVGVSMKKEIFLILIFFHRNFSANEDKKYAAVFTAF